MMTRDKLIEKINNNEYMTIKSLADDVGILPQTLRLQIKRFKLTQIFNDRKEQVIKQRILNTINNEKYYKYNDVVRLTGIGKRRLIKIIKKEGYHSLYLQNKSDYSEITKEYLVEHIKNDKYHNQRELGERMGYTTNAVCKLIKKFNLSDMYKAHVLSPINRLIKVINKGNYRNREELCIRARISKSNLSRLLNEYGLYDLYKRNKR